LETGDADGLGETRKKELIKSGITLGLRKEDDVFIIESPYAYPQFRNELGLPVTATSKIA
jgi:N-acetylglucosaminylphosphatidylinositol deacetylase